MKYCIICLFLCMGVLGMANGEPSQSWRIEVEQTDRFVRSREYRLGGAQSLSWAKHYYEHDKDNLLGMKLDYIRQVEPWPDLKWEVEAEVPELRSSGPAAHWPSPGPASSFLDERVNVIPSHYRVSHYLYGMVDRGRLPTRVRIEYEQSAYRGVCTITVLAWGKPDLSREDYVAKPSRKGAVLGLVIRTEDGGKEPPPPLSALEQSLSVDGLSLGMTSQEVLELWRVSPFETHVGYRSDRGTVVVLSGSSLDIQGKSYEVGSSVEPLIEHLQELGFKELTYPLPESMDEDALQEMKAIRENHPTFGTPAASVGLELENGKIRSVFLGGGTDSYQYEDPRLDWMGPPLTVHGLSPSLTEEQLVEKLGLPTRVHRQGELRTLCYDPEPCQNSVQQPVKLHVTFEGERCRAVRGSQLEQSGKLKLGSQFQMPPPHSLQQVEFVFNFGSLQTRPTQREEGPVTVGYCTDLGLEVWIYPDGKRQFILRDIDLPKTVIDLDFP